MPGGAPPKNNTREDNRAILRYALAWGQKIDDPEFTERLQKNHQINIRSR
jgi:hypothetical protein